MAMLQIGHFDFYDQTPSKLRGGGENIKICKIQHAKCIIQVYKHKYLSS